MNLGTVMTWVQLETADVGRGLIVAAEVVVIVVVMIIGHPARARLPHRSGAE